jgi:ABC-type antimicrobial peptide transport system permease subunit
VTSDRLWTLIGIGGHLAMSPLPHHRGTTERTGEIGIRMALGADRRDVRWLVLRDTLTLVVIGVVIGIPVALAGARLLASQLYEVVPNDPLTHSRNPARGSHS